jgi:hypothetical protein
MANISSAINQCNYIPKGGNGGFWKWPDTWVTTFQLALKISQTNLIQLSDLNKVRWDGSELNKGVREVTGG